MGASVTPPAGPDPEPDAGSGSTGRPGGLLLVAAGVCLEAVLLVGLAVMIAVELVRGASDSVGVSIFLVAFFAGVAWALVAATRALWSGRRGGRAPLVVWQIMQGLVGVSLLTSGPLWAVLGGVVLLLVAAAVLVALMTRRVVEATSG